MEKTMEVMTAEQIKEYAAEILKNHLGTRYPKLEVGFMTDTNGKSNNGEYLTVTDNLLMGWRIPVVRLIRKGQDTEKLEQYLKEQMDSFLVNYADTQDAYDLFARAAENIEIAMEHLAPYVFDVSKSDELLTGYPYRRIGDIALRCHLSYQGEKNRIHVSVTNEAIQKWGITEDELFAAMFNRCRKNAFLSGTKETVYVMDREAEHDKKPVNYLNSGNAKMVFGLETEFILGCHGLCDFGAAMIFDPMLMMKVEASFEDDFYILPVCTDNVIVTPVAGRTGKRTIAGFYDDMNRIDGELAGKVRELPKQLMKYQKSTGKIVVVPKK